MVWIIIFILFISIFGLGFYKLIKLYKKRNEEFSFTVEYRNNFITFANNYSNTSSSYDRKGNFDNGQYGWLTRNVNKMQSNLGQLGVMEYIAPFQGYRVSNYPIIINSLPKFRDDSIMNFDIHSVDDCLMRYIGVLEDEIEKVKKDIKNPIIWFRVGIGGILSIPLLILNWFGIFNNQTLDKVRMSTLYSIVSGIIALITLISGIVTIIVGKDEAILFLKSLFNA